MRWTAGRRATGIRKKQKREGGESHSQQMGRKMAEGKESDSYRVRRSVLCAAPSSSVVLSLLCVQRLTGRSYSHWDGDLILAKTGQKSSYREEKNQRFSK